MWILVLLSLSGLHQPVLLERYPTQDVCLAEQARITLELQKSYPGDTDFKLECQPPKV